MAADPQLRKALLTINNPQEKGLDRETIKFKLMLLSSAVYWIIVNEIGQGGTPHTHIYIAFSSGVRFSRLQRLFDGKAHIERANGTSEENRLYLLKEGKWADTEKADTRVEGSFEEWGEMPTERKYGFSIESAIIELIKGGATNAEILLKFPDYLRGLRDIEYVRQTLKAEENRDKWRNITTTYIWGRTGTGKTRSVMDSFGYSNVYAVNDYRHPFDGYAGEDVMLFDEFTSKSIRIQDMNNYLDGYPLSLPARYSNKQACYEKVFIISNSDLLYQYQQEQEDQSEVFAAFIRRIHKVIHFNSDGTRNEYDAADYMKDRADKKVIRRLFAGAKALDPATPTPFDDRDDSPQTR
ncbi:MAG: replication protein [Clostridiales bacterium]|jgi:hypothetical protein|nr:replication protein [Clostridiales bacterium]